MSDNFDSALVRRGRLKLLAILAIFIVPFGIAAVMHQQYREGNNTLEVATNGELVWPAVPLNDFSLSEARGERRAVNLDWMKDRWTLVYPAPGECDEVCRQNTYHMRQIHVSLGKEAHRVQRLLVTEQPAMVESYLGSEYPKLMLSSGSSTDIKSLTGQLEAATSALPAQNDSMYLVDPHGNIMMRFSPDQDPKGILKDIKRALKASRIG